MLFFIIIILFVLFAEASDSFLHSSFIPLLYVEKGEVTDPNVSNKVTDSNVDSETTGGDPDLKSENFSSEQLAKKAEEKIFKGGA